MEENKLKKLAFDMPDIPTLLKVGAQFGHQTKRWNPKMQDYIFAVKGGIHIIDITKTQEELEKALKFLVDAASRGPVLFVGTKRQAREIVKNAAVDAGAFFVVNRWVGGLLTNKDSLNKSLRKLADLEKTFEVGVEGRTKYEVSRMKKEWERSNRLYEGIKNLKVKPTALVVIDAKFEKNAIREAKKIGVPVVSIVDTNSDPDKVNYPIPGNDDAIKSLQLFFDLFAKAVKQGNGGKGIMHEFKDYSKLEVEIRKREMEDAEIAKAVDAGPSKIEMPRTPAVKVSPASRAKTSGILEQVQKAKEEKIQSPKQKLEKKIKKIEVEKAAKVKKPKKVSLSDRTEKALESAKLTLKKAQGMSDEKLAAVKGIGQKSIEEIRKA